MEGWATYTKATGVTVAVPATDSDGAVIHIRSANCPAVSGGVLIRDTTYPYSRPVSWSLANTTYGGSIVSGDR